MNITIGWHDEAKRILRLNCSGTWCWPDLDQQMDRWLVDQPVLIERLYIVADVRQVTMLPNDMILHVKPVVQFVQETDTQVVVVAANAAAAALFKLFITMYKSMAPKFQLASTVEEALTLLTCGV